MAKGLPMWSALFVMMTASALPRGGLRRYVRERAAAAGSASLAEAAGGDLYHVQRLDHFDRSLNATFAQRYFLNATFFKRAAGPVFLCVGGEGPALDATVLYHSVHCSDATELAESAGALLVALEHRFYGKSVPASGERGAARLRHLSSQQAVGDIATFHAFLSAKMNLTAANKWVAFGGSYPGMVSGFARLKLPHLIHAAVSSSSPWRAKVDMPEYNDVVAEALALASIGGSKACEAAVAEGHEAIQARLKAGTAARRQLAATFNLCDADALEDEAARRAWVGYGVIDVPAQENDPFLQNVNESIGVICQILADGASPFVDALAAVSDLQRGGACADLEDLVAPMPPDDGSDFLSWPWQTCSEFGFYQTCEVGSRCPFGKGDLVLADEIGMCEDAFGISQRVVAANVAFSDVFYGADKPKGTRIYFPNGDVDPWHGLGVVETPGPEEPVLMVSGASHHAWTHPADEIHQPTVAQAKEKIQTQVLLWLAEP